MSAEGVGAYIVLLCHAWEGDGLEDNMPILRRLTGASDESITEAKAKFELADDGRLRNRRQEETRAKLADYQAQQSARALKRWSKPVKNGFKSKAKSMPRHTKTDATAYQNACHGNATASENACHGNASASKKACAGIEEEKPEVCHGIQNGMPRHKEVCHGIQKPMPRHTKSDAGALPNQIKSQITTNDTPRAGRAKDSPYNLGKSIERIENKMKLLEQRHRSEVAGNEFRWDNQAKRQEWFDLKKKADELDQRMMNCML